MFKVVESNMNRLLYEIQNTTINGHKKPSLRSHRTSNRFQSIWLKIDLYCSHEMRKSIF